MKSVNQDPEPNEQPLERTPEQEAILDELAEIFAAEVKRQLAAKLSERRPTS